MLKNPLFYIKKVHYQKLAVHELASQPEPSQAILQLDQTLIDASAEDPAAALKKLGGAKVILCTAPNAKVIESLMPGLAVDGTLLLLALEATPITISPSKLFRRVPLFIALMAFSLQCP